MKFFQLFCRFSLNFNQFEKLEWSSISIIAEEFLDGTSIGTNEIMGRKVLINFKNIINWRGSTSGNHAHDERSKKQKTTFLRCYFFNEDSFDFSIHDEREQQRNDSTVESAKVLLLKTSQSEKIAQISQQIEQQVRKI